MCMNYSGDALFQRSEDESVESNETGRGPLQIVSPGPWSRYKDHKEFPSNRGLARGSSSEQCQPPEFSSSSELPACHADGWGCAHRGSLPSDRTCGDAQKVGRSFGSWSPGESSFPGSGYWPKRWEVGAQVPWEAYIFLALGLGHLNSSILKSRLARNNMLLRWACLCVIEKNFLRLSQVWCK